MDPLTIACISGGANIVLGIVAALLKRALDANEKRLGACENNAASLQLAISLVRETLPMHYVRRDEYRDDITEIKGMLVRIFDKLDEKADKP